MAVSRQESIPQVLMEDLLGREPVQVDAESIRRWIDDKTIMITGSAGSIGTELSQQVLQLFSPTRLILVDRSETGQFFLERKLQKHECGANVNVLLADILDYKRMKRIMDDYQPDIVFHAAAYKRVPLMERHPGEAVKNVVLATRHLADLASDCCVQTFVLISTDKTVKTSVMGACKRAIEMYIQAKAGTCSCRFVTVRFGNVLDSAGSVVQIFRQQIADGGPVTVTHPDIERYFMTIPEAAQLVIQAGSIGGNGEILLLDVGKSVRIVDLATDMIRLSGLEVAKDIQIEYIGLCQAKRSMRSYIMVTRSVLILCIQRSQDRSESDSTLDLIDRLIKLADEHPEIIMSGLKHAVPEYSRHVMVCSLDETN